MFVTAKSTISIDPMLVPMDTMDRLLLFIRAEVFSQAPEAIRNAQFAIRIPRNFCVLMLKANNCR